MPRVRPSVFRAVSGSVEQYGGAAFPPALPALTSIRFLFALGVVLFHYSLQWSFDTASLTVAFNKARLGVDAFFILSGFVLTHAYRRALAEGTFHYRRFILARFARVYPAHLAVLAFVVAMVLAASAAGNDFDRSFYEPAGLILTLLLLQSWGPEIVRAEWNGPSWSLSAEWFAYVTFPVFAAIGLMLRERPIILLALSVALFGLIDASYIALFGRTVVHAEINLGILRIIPEFLYGIALYRLGERLQPTARQALLGALAAGLGFAALMHFGADDRLIVAAAGPLILTLALLSKAGVDRIVARPWLLAAGEASYALYLVHMPILIGWKGVLAAMRGRASTYVLAPWEILGLLFLTLAVSFALHAAVERPARDYLRRLADRRWPAAQVNRVPTGSQPPDV